MKQPFLSKLLAVAMVFHHFPVAVLAAEEYTGHLALAISCDFAGQTSTEHFSLQEDGSERFYRLTVASEAQKGALREIAKRPHNRVRLTAQPQGGVLAQTAGVAQTLDVADGAAIVDLGDGFVSPSLPMPAPVGGGVETLDFNVPQHSSMPGALDTVFLEFRGTNRYNGGNPIPWGGFNVSEPPFSLDGDTANLSASERNAITKIWKTVAEAYSPFKVNVTTVDPGVYNNGRTAVLMIGGSSFIGPAGGVAFVGGLTSPMYNNFGWVFPANLAANPKYIADATNHECGHLFGLSHQSVYNETTQALIAEYESGPTIMGVAYSSSYARWKYGRNSWSFSMLQDDHKIIANNGARLRDDDHGNALATATALSFANNVATVYGVISSTGDVDYVRVVPLAGTMAVAAGVAEEMPMLNTVLKIYDNAGVLLQTANTGSFPESLSLSVGNNPYYISVQGTDPYGALNSRADVGQFYLTITNTPTVQNNPPTASNQSVSTPEDTAKAVTLSATDPEGNPLTYSIVTGPSNGALSGAGANRTYTPNANYNGPDSFTFRANDGTSDSNVATVSITVTPVNDAPIASNQSVSTSEDVAKAITLVATDVEGSSLTYTIVSAPSNGALTGSGANRTYTPNANYNGPDSFTFRANDGASDSNVATVSITVTPVNDAPIASNQSVSTSEDVAKAITLVATDVEGSSLTYTIVSAPSNGALTGSGANRTYTPNANYNGPDSFTFKTNDGALDSNVATVSITVTPVNDAPVANGQAVLVQMATPISITLSGSDVEGGPLSYSILSSPSNGALTGTPPNVSYMSVVGFTGSDSFTFKVNDGDLDSPTATVSITVTSLSNSPPIASNQTVSTPEDTAKAIVLIATDAEGNPLTYSIVTGPSNGALTGSGANRTYTPNANYNGPDIFTFRANDGASDSNVATVSITVTPVNDAPVSQNQGVSTPENSPKAITLQATDVDGGALAYSIVASPAHGTLTGSGADQMYTPDPGYNGTDSFTFRANDGALDSNVATVSITVTPVNDPPIAANQSVDTDEDTVKIIALSATDPDGDPLSYAILSGPSHGSLSGAGANRTYTPSADYNGSDSFTFKVNDGVADSNAATVSIVVAPVNDAPVASGQSISTPQNVAVSMTLSASDIDGNTLSYSVTTAPQHGALSGAPPVLIYTPAAGYIGSDSFQFNASDGSLDSAAATVSIVVSAGPANQPPQVEAGADITVIFPAPASLNGIVIDDGLPNPPARTTVNWRVESGPGSVTFSAPSSANTIATFSGPGRYVLKLIALDGALSTGDTIEVMVSAPSQNNLFGKTKNIGVPDDPIIIVTNLSEPEFVSIKILDRNGREITRLVNEQRAAGSYSDRWDAVEAPSGTYSALIETGRRRDRLKLVVIH